MSDLEVDLEQDTDSSTQFAYEVSEAWIAAEEAIAADITQKENCILLGQHTDSTGESDAEVSATLESKPLCVQAHISPCPHF